MDLKDFVKVSLQQILEGVKEAQSTDHGSHINAENAGGIPQNKNVFSSGTYGTFTVVEFDVAVSAESSGGGNANLKVLGVGVGGGAEHKAGTANRIAFAVPVRLPDGDRHKAQERSGRSSGGSWQAA